MTLKNNRGSLLSNIKLCASFHHHMQTGVTVRKPLSWVWPLWAWPLNSGIDLFAWTLLWSLVITPEYFMMIWWWKHGERGVTDRRTDRWTDRQTDRQTENTIHRAAWCQLKIKRREISAETGCFWSISLSYNIIPSGSDVRIDEERQKRLRWTFKTNAGLAVQCLPFFIKTRPRT